MSTPTTYVSGLENVLMGDDGFGPAAVRAFEAEYVVGPIVTFVAPLWGFFPPAPRLARPPIAAIPAPAMFPGQFPLVRRRTALALHLR